MLFISEMEHQFFRKTECTHYIALVPQDGKLVGASPVLVNTPWSFYYNPYGNFLRSAFNDKTLMDPAARSIQVLCTY